MKIKKVGDLPENELENKNIESNEPQFTVPKSSDLINKKFIIAGGVIFVVLVIFAIYFFAIKDKSGNENTISDKSTTGDELKLKELELKERELKLKEQQLNSNKGNISQEGSSAGSFENLAAGQVTSWINYLATDKSTAYYMMSPKQRGDYYKFNSTKAYGGISSTKVFDCTTSWSSGCYAEVIADYESLDPYNKNGRYKQKFFINNCSGQWQITDIKNISIQLYN